MRVHGLPPAPLLLAAAIASGCAPQGPRPDVIVISLDTVRGDELAFDDPELAPHLTRLARRGVVFERAVSGSSWTLPAHAQLFTGQPPGVHGVQADQRRIDPLTPTLPELLARAGYFTAGVWSGWYLAGAYGFARGFARYECALEGVREGGAQLLAELGGNVEAARRAFVARERASHAEVSSERVVERARELLAVPAAGDPLLLFAHFFDPHYDYVPPPPYDARFDPDYEGDLDGSDYFDNPRVWDPVLRERTIGERDLQHVRALYRGEIAWTDAAVGELLAELERTGRLEDALIVVTSDHGEEFFEHGERGHRRALYEESIRVPLLIVPPGAPEAPAPHRVADLVGLSDLLPTILDYAGLPVPDSVYGRSLRPLVEGRGLAPRPQLASLTFYYGRGPGGVTYHRLEALHAGDHKLVRRLRVDPGRSEPVVELQQVFDLSADPRELRPRTAPGDPGLRDAWEALEAETARQRRFLSGLPRSSPEERATTVRRLFAQELRGLGYAAEDLAPLAEVEPAWVFEPTPRVEPPR